MSTYTAMARTNYFHVTDRAALEASLASTYPAWGHEVVDDTAGRVAVLDVDGYGWPTPTCPTAPADVVDDDVTGACVECDRHRAAHQFDDVSDLISAHLVGGQVAVLIEVGHEKLRYGMGRALAVNSEGDREQVNLDDIYDKAASLGEYVTDAAG